MTNSGPSALLRLLFQNQIQPRPPSRLYFQMVARAGAYQLSQRGSRTFRLITSMIQTSTASGNSWSHAIGAAPNMRLKLAAPGCQGRIPFVKDDSTRRSLSAIR
jgi:hypothetical protein